MAMNFTRTTPGGPEDRETESTVSLVRRLMDETTTLFRQEIALATREISGSLLTFLSAVASVAAGGALLFAGLLVLLAAAVLGLSTVMRPWLAALSVGVIACVIGYVIVHFGRKALKPSALVPTRSAESLRHDKDVLARKLR